MLIRSKLQQSEAGLVTEVTVLCATGFLETAAVLLFWLVLPGMFWFVADPEASGRLYHWREGGSEGGSGGPLRGVAGVLI